MKGLEAEFFKFIFSLFLSYYTYNNCFFPYWQVKLSAHLNDGPHFLVLVSSAPAKSRLPPGPARLHIQDKGFCLTTGVPPRVAGQWMISDLRRYGVVEGRFCFEGGSRCMKGEGLFVLLTDQGEEITSTLKVALTGNLHSSRRRPVSRNMSGIIFIYIFYFT